MTVCPHCGIQLQVTLNVETVSASLDAPRTNGRIDPQSQMRLINRELERFIFWRVLLKGNENLGIPKVLGPESSPETILAMDTGDFGDYFGPYRCSLVIRALLKANVPPAQILESPLWRDATTNRRYFWRHHYQFKKLVRELEGAAA